MKRKASLLLVLVFVLALLSGCGGAKTGGNEQPSTEVTASASAEPAQSTEPAQSAEPTQSQYRFAAGKYETDAAGWPTGSFTYEEPFCYTDEVFTLWTSNFTPYLLPEDGPEGIDFNQEEQRRTGVDIEYIIISSETRGENFAALLAADDLPDIMANADGYYNGSMLKGIAEGYFLNIYDYKQYAPNYFYFIRSNMEDDPYVYDKSFQNETTVGSFVAFDTTPGMTLSPVAIRNDWLRKLNYDIDKLRTLDKLTEVGKAFQVEFGYDFNFGFLSIAMDSCSFFDCYDTYTTLHGGYYNTFPSPRLDDNGEVHFYYSEENSLTFLRQVEAWRNDRLIDPDFMNIDPAAGYPEYVGLAPMAPAFIDVNNAANPDPDCDWEVLPKVSLYEGQVHHLGKSYSHADTLGKTQINAKIDNPELAVTWCDWRYSPAGSFLGSFGCEGTTWKYDENGNIISTEFAGANPDGHAFAWIMLTYSMNYMMEHGLKDTRSVFLYPGGDRAWERLDYMKVFEYDGKYEWPKGVTLTEEQAEVYYEYAIDLDTFICENILLFASGEKPLSEWDRYIEQLKSIGLDEAEGAYQEAYEDYMAKVAARGF